MNTSKPQKYILDEYETELEATLADNYTEVESQEEQIAMLYASVKQHLEQQNKKCTNKLTSKPV